MALCLAESLITAGFNPEDQMQRYVRWWRTGHMSCTRSCFDIGITTRSALARFEETGEPFAGSVDEFSAGNGSLMRLAPVPLFFWRSAPVAILRSGESSRTTHGAAAAVDACRLYGGFLIAALEGADKAEIVKHGASISREHQLTACIAQVALGSFTERHPPAIRGSGYVVESLEAALWAFYHSDSFEEGALKAVNLGDDADTTGAVFGQLAGVYYGDSGIPVRWREKLAWRDRIESLAERLYEGSQRRPV